MELPARLRHAVDKALEGIPLSELTPAAAVLSDRYRGERLDGELHLASDLMVRAYLAARLPATYAAIRDAMAKLSLMRPDFAPLTLLDIGSGPGTALWAAADCWPILSDAVMIETSSVMRSWGEKLSALAPVGNVEWRHGDATSDLGPMPPRDLVCLGYVLSELPTSRRPKLIDDLWSRTAGVLLIVEPGTPKGW